MNRLEPIHGEGHTKGPLSGDLEVLTGGGFRGRAFDGVHPDEAAQLTFGDRLPAMDLPLHWSEPKEPGGPLHVRVGQLCDGDADAIDVVLAWLKAAQRPAGRPTRGSGLGTKARNTNKAGQ